MESNLQNKGMLADPGDHFIGRYEVEYKFRVRSFEPCRRRLGDLGATAFALDNHETDVFLDFADQRLETNGQSQVLREMQPSGRVLWISKGPAADECVAMDLPEFKKAMAMLLSLGFVEQMRLRKRRDIFLLSSSHVTLDGIEGLGSFVEVAAMTDDQEELPKLRKRLLHEVERLGLSHEERVHQSYRELLTESI